MIKLIPRVENSTAMVLLSPLLALTLTALSAYLIFVFILVDIPVRVKGPVNKGQAIYAWEDGVCSTIATTALIGMALESNTDDSEKLVECVLKV